MIIKGIFLLLILFIVFYIVTYPYNFKLERKLKRVTKFKEIEVIEEGEPSYKNFSQEELDNYFSLEEKEVESKYVNEKMRYTILSPKKLEGIPKCLILLHGIRDNSNDWIDRAMLRENYLTLRKEGKVDEMVFIIVNSGHHGESWYTNFFKDDTKQYEEFFSKDLIREVEEMFPKPLIGIGGFSMGGYGALKLGLKNLEKFVVVASFSGAISLIRMSINRRVMRLFRYLYVPRFLFNDFDKNHFVRVFSPWGYKILKNDPYSIIKTTPYERYKNVKFYLSVGLEDKKPYLMLQQWLDVVGRIKKYQFDFKGMLYKSEFHTWKFISRDIYNFLIFFSTEIKGERKK